MKNIDLKQKYDDVYKGDSSKFYSFNTFLESKLILEMIESWNGLRVLEIGCGEGRLAAMMSFAGAGHVDAVDYSQEAINIARQRIQLDNVDYQCADFRDIGDGYDVVVMQGVLEHLDEPFVELKNMIENKLKITGTLITSSPSFLNPRGYVWMALKLLLDVPMSHTDLHFFCPFDFEKFAADNNYSLRLMSTDQDWGSGERTIIDFQKRLKNALRDANMDNSKVDCFLDWLRKALPYHNRDDFSGATVVYRLSR